MGIRVTRNDQGGYTASGNYKGKKVSADGFDWASAIINLLKLLGLACVIVAAVWLSNGNGTSQESTNSIKQDTIVNNH